LGNGFLELLVILKQEKAIIYKKEVRKSSGTPFADDFWLSSLPFEVSIFVFREVGELDWLCCYLEHIQKGLDNE
jgi:hypothetical protein